LVFDSDRADFTTAATPDRQKGKNSGILKPIALPTGHEYLSLKLRQLRAVEPDVLMGRRGVPGWDGKHYSSGLLINGPIVNPPKSGLPYTYTARSPA